ncbi:MAG: hypothetical protein DI533_17180 [Cereibacter sphaeroides]|uniref:Uncharacterized protein n=1 Tax=Cereibacter sphaeroides TaxID=1063 RepID=A0A2W5S392_CERSP|nr:MAG: hypothetical protein DI533_17180 [Cereibacter sphaeroides]
MTIRLKSTLRTLRQISSVSEKEFELDDASLVGDIALVLKILQMELKSVNDGVALEPRFLLSLSKLFQLMNDHTRAATFFAEAAASLDQSRGYYIDLGSSAKELYQSTTSEELREGIRTAIQELVAIGPFPDELTKAVGTTFQ